MDNALYQSVAEEILEADRILIITGAGISADSGMPTYRGIGGLYDNQNTDEGIPIEKALSHSMIEAHPEITWKYLWQIGKACAEAKPNIAHEIITKIQELRPDTWVLTQNIDNLHRLAGNKNLIEIHGNAFHAHCTKCNRQIDPEKLIGAYKHYDTSKAPVCDECGGIIRPQVVLFEEMLPETAIDSYYEILDSNLDLVISIGTSSQFPYIQEPIMFASRYGIPTVEINPTATPISQIVTYNIQDTAAKAMPKIWKYIIEGLQDDHQV